MLKSDKFYSSSVSLISGIILILIGLCMIFGQDKLYFDFIKLFMLAVLVLGFIQFIRYFFKRQKETEKKINFTKSVFYYLFCIILSFFPKIPMSILPILFAIYLICSGIVKLISHIVLFYSHAHGAVKEFILFIIYVGFGIPLLIFPLDNINVMLYIIGGYFILLGINFLKDFVNDILPKKVKNKVKRKIRITLPLLFEAIIPYAVLNEINYYINKEEYDKDYSHKSKDINVKPDMEILVHVSMRGYNRMGHVDIVYNNNVYSYGGYDDKSLILFNTVGDGVLFITDKNKYIQFCISHSYKTLFSFGLKLNDKQKENVEKYLETLQKDTIEWKPPILNNNSNQEYDDYSSCLYKKTKARFYKFKKGKFKKFFVLGSNCCLLADSIIGKTGTEILKMNGIITPGTYYEYLNREFNKKNSMVITKNIYNEESIGISNKKIKKFKGFSK